MFLSRSITSTTRSFPIAASLSARDRPSSSTSTSLPPSTTCVSQPHCASPLSSRSAARSSLSRLLAYTTAAPSASGVDEGEEAPDVEPTLHTVFGDASGEGDDIAQSTPPLAEAEAQSTPPLDEARSTPPFAEGHTASEGSESPVFEKDGTEVVRLLRERRPRRAQNLFEELRSQGVIHTQKTYNWVLWSYVRTFPPKVPQIYEWMRQDDVKASVGSHNAVLAAHIKLKDYFNAELTLRRIQNEGLSFSADTYHLAMGLYVNQSALELAENLLTSMKLSRVPPDVITYTSIISLYAREGLIAKAEAHFEEMREFNLQPSIVTYNVMINMYGKASQLIRAEGMVEALKQDGLSPNEVTHTSLINMYARAGEREKAEEQFRAMIADGCRVTAGYNALLDFYSKSNAITSAEALFEMIPQKPLADQDAGTQQEEEDVDVTTQPLLESEGLNKPFYANTVTFNTMIEMYIRRKQLDKVDKLLKRMEELGLPLTIYTYNTMISAYTKAGRFEQAFRYYDKLCAASHLRPSAATYNIMINLHSKSERDGKQALAFFEKMKKEGCVPNVYTYNTLLNIHAKMKDFDAVDNVLNDMFAAGVRPSEITYSTILTAYGTAKRYTDAKKLFWELVSDGAARAVVYNAFLGVLRKVGAIEEAEQLFQRMLEDGVPPDTTTFNIMLSLYNLSAGVGAKHCNKAKEIFELLLKTPNIKPDLITYNTLIDVYSKGKRFASAKETHEKLLDSGLSPDDFTNSIMLMMYARTRNTSKIMEFHQQLKSQTRRSSTIIYNSLLRAASMCALKPIAEVVYNESRENRIAIDSKTYDTLLEMCSTTKDIRFAQDIFEHMRAKRVPLTSHVFNVMIALYTRVNKPDNVEYTLKQMAGRKIKPTVDTYNSLVHFYKRQSNYAKLDETIAKMDADKIKFDAVTFNSIISAYTKANRTKDALVMHRRMVEEGVEPSVITFNCLLKLHMNTHNYTMVELVICDMKQAGIDGDLVTYNTLLSLEVRRKSFEEAEELFHELKKKFTPDLFSYNTMIDMYYKKGDYKTAECMYQELLLSGVMPTTVTFQIMINVYEALGQTIKRAQMFEYYNTVPTLPQRPVSHRNN